MQDEELRALERRAATGDASAAALLARERERGGTPEPPTHLRPPIHGLVLVLGGRGSGKTLMLQALVERGRREGAPFVVFDRLGHWLPKRGLTIVRQGSPEQAAELAIKRAPCTLVIDEIDLAVPSRRLPAEGSALHEILHIGRQASAQGRWARRGPVALLGAARRPFNVHPDLRGLLDRLYLGRMFEPRDLAWVEQVAGAAVAARLPELATGEFLAIDCA